MILGWYKGPLLEIPKWWQIDKQTNRQTDFPLVDSVGGVEWKYLLRKVDWRCWVQVWIISGLLNRHQFIKNTTLFIWTRLKQIHHMAVFQVSFEDCQKLEMVVFILPCVCNLSWPGSAFGLLSLTAKSPLKLMQSQEHAAKLPRTVLPSPVLISWQHRDIF